MASGSDDRKIVTVTAAYKDTPPQIFVSQVNTFFRGLDCDGFRVELQWEKVITQEDTYQEEIRERRLRGVPLGYQSSEVVPLHRGPNHCRKCLCSPCIIQRPPDFLRGCCDPHPANVEKRYMLYRKFWRCLDRLGVWRDEDYLRRKEERTRRDDRRDIMPDCVIEEIRRRYPSEDGQYRDYMSTFDASMDIDYDSGSADYGSIDYIDDSTMQ